MKGQPDLQMYITTSRVRGSRRRGRNASNRYFARVMTLDAECAKREAEDARKRAEALEAQQYAQLKARRVRAVKNAKPRTKRRPS